MTLQDFNHPRSIKRVRSTRAQVEARRAALYEIVAAGRPMTVRQVFYQATVRSVIEKTEAGYQMVKTDLVDLRQAGVVPYEWLDDSTRWQRRPNTHGSVEDALNETAQLYRKWLWRDVFAYVEVWLEKDALAGVVYPITEMFDVGLMVSRGYSSLSFIHASAQYLKRLGATPINIYHLGDYDPSGVDAGRDIEKKLRAMAPTANITFERLAVTPEQIAAWSLPSRPTKPSDTRSKGFGDISVELDAIPPDSLRQLVRDAIERHLPPDQFAVLKQAEASERRLINGLVGMLTTDEGGRA